MHIEAKSWFRLSNKERDSKLVNFGINFDELRKLRSLPPKQKILEATKIALMFDPLPSHDFIECIAGYSGRGGIYNHFQSLNELINSVPKLEYKGDLEKISLNSDEVDLTNFIPNSIGNTDVWIEPDKNDKRKIVIWQKTTGKMRYFSANRKIKKNLFLTGIALYAGEGTKYSKKSRKIEIVNSNPSVIRLFISFLKNFGIEKSKLSARVHIHHKNEKTQAQKFWISEIGLIKNQFNKPNVKPSRNFDNSRRVFVIDINVSNTMLLNLLNYWTTNLEKIVQKIGNN